MSAFDKALDHVLRFEGGFVDHPLDPGGATNYGVTQATYDAWRRAQGQEPRSVREIERVEVRSIYWGRYWLPAGCEQLPAPLAFVVFDSAVNSGLHRALKWLEQTRDWREYLTVRLDFLTGLATWPTFGKGWARRLAAVQRVAVDLEDAQRLLLVFDEDGNEVARVPFSGSVVARSRGDRVYVRAER